MTLSASLKYLCLLSALPAADVSAQYALRINEFMASNGASVADVDGEYSDWIELYNAGDEEISLQGWALTDKKSKPAKWVFPAQKMAAHSYLLLFASGKDRTVIDAELHTNFKLSASGDYLALIAPDGVAATVLDPFPAQTKDVSYGVTDEAAGLLTWGFFTTSTPGADNAGAAAMLESPAFSVDHGFYDAPFSVSMSSSAATATAIYYTTDGSVPTPHNGTLYTDPLRIATTTVLRAVAVPTAGGAWRSSRPATATYLFVADVVRQDNAPAGYPAAWGPYLSIKGTSVADYEMDPELMSDGVLAQKTIAGLRSLPVVSLVTDRDHLFSAEKNDSTGGIYIYTGGDSGSTSNGYGADWVRPASIEFFSADAEAKEMQIDCAIKIHGNASRMPEKTPKHSIRLQFKSAYGPSKLDFPLFGKKQVREFNQLVLRAGFGNTWCHWTEGQRKPAMFTRDAWAKRMTTRLGHLAPATTFAHLYINGLYWGLYNPTERPDGDFAAGHLGGDETDYDVIRISDGEGLDAQTGDMNAYNRLLSFVNNSADYTLFQKMQGNDVSGVRNESYEILLDEQSYIDFMILNQYAGNTDWDHHNWVTVRPRDGHIGFQWMPWDSELMLCSVNDNVVNKNNEKCPSAMFRLLMQKSPRFKMDYSDAVYRHCIEPFGAFTPDSVQAVWQKLTDEIDQAVYAESARWGDYRRDVHPYSSRGALYLKEDQYDKQKTFMTATYFPQRTSVYVQQLTDAGYYASLTTVPKVYINDEESVRATDTIKSGDEIRIVGSYKVYYTTDGSDPLGWTSGGYAKKNDAALTYAEPLRLTESCTLRVRSYLSSKGWSPLRERQIVVRSDSALSIRDLPQCALRPTLDLTGDEVAVLLSLTSACDVRITLTDACGRAVARQHCRCAVGDQRLTVASSLPGGVYLVHLECSGATGRETFSLKLMK